MCGIVHEQHQTLDNYRYSRDCGIGLHSEGPIGSIRIRFYMLRQYCQEAECFSVRTTMNSARHRVHNSQKSFLQIIAFCSEVD